MEKKVIIINGTGGSGKDTFTEFCAKHLKVYNYSTIDRIKEIAKEFGWNGTKTDKDRKFLSDLKKLATEYNDMPYKLTIDSIDEFMKSDYDIMFIHIREPEEIKKVVNEVEAKTLLIKRKDHDIIKTNISDASIEGYDYDYDYVILNTTLEEFEEEAKRFIKELQLTK